MEILIRSRNYWYAVYSYLEDLLGINYPVQFNKINFKLSIGTSCINSLKIVYVNELGKVRVP